MTYAIRNSIIIFGLVILVVVFNMITKNNTTKQLESINMIYQQKMEELNTLKRVNPDLEKEKEIMAQHDVMQTKALNRTKFILKEDNPILSYAYFTAIAERFAGNLEFNFRYEGAGTFSNTNYNQYSLKGSGTLAKIYRFLHHIENQSALMKIEKIELQETEEEVFQMRQKSIKKIKVLGFAVSLLTFYESSGKTYEELVLRNISVPSVTANPFFAKIYPPKDSDEDSHYIDIDNAKIIGLSHNTATLKEGNKVAILEPGDKVLHGFLEMINWEEEYAVFKSDAMGITVEAKLYLERE